MSAARSRAGPPSCVPLMPFRLVEELPLIAMHQRRRTLTVTLVADREERGSGPVDNDRSEQNDGLAGVEPAQGREVADLGGGQLRGGVEVEALQGGLLLELRSAQAPFESDGLAA